MEGDLSNWCVSASPKGGELMSVLRVYGDESGKEADSEVISMAGFIATIDEWGAFEASWRKMLLNNKNAPYLHIKELRANKLSKNGPFCDWRQSDIDAFLKCAVDEILSSPLRGFGCAVIKSDFVRFNNERGLGLDIYSFCLYLFACIISVECNNEPYQIIMDRLAKGNSKVAKAEEYFHGDKWMNWRNWPTITVLSEDDKTSSYNTPALQAADFAAWEARVSIHNKLAWFREEKPYLRRDQFNLSVLEFQAKQKGKTIINKDNFLEIRDRMPLARLHRAEKMILMQLDYERLVKLWENRELIVDPSDQPHPGFG